jgi:hypothetical protein
MRLLRVAAAVLASAIILGSVLCVASMGPVVLGSVPVKKEQAIDGEAFWDHLTNITNISEAHEAYRVAGSTGAEAVADYIELSFKDIGLETRSEGFMFTGWDLDEGSFLRMDEDGDPSTLDDVHPIASFVPEAYSWPTENGSGPLEMAVLPMPEASSYLALRGASLPLDDWDELNTSGKVLIVAREMRWRSDWESQFVSKLREQTPAGLVYVWYYDWMGYAEEMSFASTGGRPLGPNSGYLWELEIPTGSVNTSDGKVLMAAAAVGEPLLSMSIPSAIGTVAHRNVVAEVPGLDKERTVLITAHYDSVMCQGAIDNAGGVAAMLQIASHIMRSVQTGALVPKYNLVFVAFAAEELGMVGSAHFVAAHSNEMEDYVAMINLDCIGSAQMCITGTPASGGIDLDRLFHDQAEVQGVSLQITNTGGSDQDTFRSPQAVEGSINSYWGWDLDLSEVKALDQATMVYSLPLSLTDGREGASPGYIHTTQDGFDDGITWVDKGSMVAQVQVVVGAVMELSEDEGTSGESISTYILIMAVVGLAAIGAWLVVKRRKGKM